MIVKFHKRGAGHGRGPVEYLLGKDFQRDKATLLRGDPHQTIDLIDASNFSKRYTSGVLSFKENDIPGHHKQAIMDDFERVLLAGLEPDQYDILWVEHQDKDRLELNFVIPNTELTTGKRLQPYYRPADFRRVNAWQNLTNLEYGFHDPNDPANKRLMIPPTDAFKNRKNAVQAITGGLTALAEQGLVKDRETVLEALTGAGFDVVRETKQSISVADPSGGKNLRLKGALYERDFRLSEQDESQIRAASERFNGSSDSRAAEYREELETGIELKREANQKRYSGKRKSPDERSESPEPDQTGRSTARDELGAGSHIVSRHAPTGLEFMDNPELLHRPEHRPEHKRDRDLGEGGEHRGNALHHHPERSPTNSGRPNNHISAAGVSDHDRAGTGLISRIKKTIGRAQSAAASFIQDAARTVERIRDSFTGLRTNEDGMSGFAGSSEELNRASIDAQAASGAFDRAITELEYRQAPRQGLFR